MLSIKAAKQIVYKNIPDGTIVKEFTHGPLYVFLVDFGDKEERLMDAHYSVDSNTGKFSEFSMISDFIEKLPKQQ